MSEIRSNFPLYQLNLSECSQGDNSNIFTWRQNTFNNWDNKCAQRCSPPHIRTINFMWHQENVNAPDEIPEFTYADSYASFNIRANNKSFPEEKLPGKDFSLNDLKLKPDNNASGKNEGDTPINKILILREQNGKQNKIEGDIEPLIVKKIMAEVAGSDKTAQRFLDSFTTRITTLDAFFGKECQTKIRETLEKVYTIMQSVTPTIYHSFVMRGGEFKNFNELYIRCCQDKGVFKDTPSLVQNLNFLSDIAKSPDYTARSKAIVMEDKASKLFGNYKDSPIRIGEVSSKHEFKGVECYTPYLAYNTLATLMAPLSEKQRENIMTNLATKIGKALKEVNLRDMLKYKSFLHDQIDLATGAKKDFNYEEWSKGEKQNTSINAISSEIDNLQISRGRSQTRTSNNTHSRNNPEKTEARSSPDKSKWFNNMFNSLSKEDQMKMDAFYADNFKKDRLRNTTYEDKEQVEYEAEYEDWEQD